ncbi:hypothetical protein [Acinetobacter towneri]|uniref:hypothetical protein n=1 Tax=Acinetobacter towneri TaxID=202956 RepID=UPI002575183C|nr:hypothetical protein [Acinetobacter towneri]MDM1720524.1 hypothetical protein [Acinetobacter towneri]
MATLATNVSFQCFGLDGKPLAGGKVYTYSAGTTTDKATYTTMTGDVPNPNPVILDQNGKAKIFLGDGSYRLQIKDSNDALIDDIDQISRYVTQSEFATFQQTVSDGVSQLTEVREQIDVFVNTSIGNQKGFANGIAPLDVNVKVDPIYLPSLPNTAIPEAKETALGVAKIATTAIAQGGVNDTDIMTSKKVKDQIDVGGRIHATAYVSVIGSTVTILSSKNIASVVLQATGVFKVTTLTNMDNLNFTIALTSSLVNGQGGSTSIIAEWLNADGTNKRTLNSFELVSLGTQGLGNPRYFGVTVIC